MKYDKQKFITLCIDNRILRFGEFRLKSGRISPYFFNAGLFDNGHLLGQLSAYYAALINQQLKQPYMLYGPAYKGIPLAAATAIQLASHHGVTIEYAFNRKEAKDHGEGGNIVGASLKGDVVIIDDVITAGTSVSESVEIIASAGAKPAAVVIALDRQEIAGDTNLSAVQSVQKNLKIPVYSIIKLEDLISHLQQDPANRQHAAAVISYRDTYGSQIEQAK
jgi:orotate phosphoribosyltransferase